MSEMLANRYFMVGDFQSAAKEFEKVIAHCEAKSVRAKLIMCYILTDDLDAAVDSLLAELQNDRTFIPGTDNDEISSVCESVINELVRQRASSSRSCPSYCLKLGLLSAFVDVEKSAALLGTARIAGHPNFKIDAIIAALRRVSENVRTM